MAFPTFTPAYQPSMGSGYSIKPRVISNQFGDGYRQVYKDGLNTLARSFNVTWNALPTTDADDIEAFFSANVGAPFYWQSPRDSVVWKYDCLNWDRKPVTGEQDQIDATFTQRFDHDPDPSAPTVGGEGTLSDGGDGGGGNDSGG